mgnify:CR=1 FL=1
MRVKRITPIRHVREHHAPVGALRRDPEGLARSADERQGAPRTCRCIETHAGQTDHAYTSRQGAPRTCRCIETMTPRRPGPPRRVREHHAPVGALRLSHPGSEGYSGCIQVLGGAGGVGGMVQGGDVSESATKAPRAGIGGEKKRGISTILFRRFGAIRAFATDLDKRRTHGPLHGRRPRRSPRSRPRVGPPPPPGRRDV